TRNGTPISYWTAYAKPRVARMRSTTTFETVPMSSFAKHPTRTWFAAGAATAIGLAGCSAPAFEGMQPFDPQAVYGAPSGPDVPYHTPDHEDERLQCIVFGGGAKTAATISPSAPDVSPIKHVIVVMLEGRSFDHLLSDLPAVGMIELQSQ